MKRLLIMCLGLLLLSTKLQAQISHKTIEYYFWDPKPNYAFQQYGRIKYTDTITALNGDFKDYDNVKHTLRFQIGNQHYIAKFDSGRNAEIKLYEEMGKDLKQLKDM